MFSVPDKRLKNGSFLVSSYDINSGNPTSSLNSPGRAPYPALENNHQRRIFSFTPKGWGEPICASGITPLVIITTNEERALPPAFLRRCLVLYLELVKDGEDLIEHLVKRGRAHFKDMDADVLREAAGQLQTDRKHAIDNQLKPLPGQAEYLDLLRALHYIAPDDAAKQLKKLKEIAPFVVQKHSGSEQ